MEDTKEHKSWKEKVAKIIYLLIITYMVKKITITEKQRQQFNYMFLILTRIKSYQTVEKLRRDSNKDWGIDFEEALEMAYENVLGEAKAGAK